MNNFFFNILQHTPTDIESIVVVAHLVPGVDEFVLAMHQKIPVSAVIPKPNSINQHVVSKIEPHVPILRYSRAAIGSRTSAFLDELKNHVSDKRFAVIDTDGYFSQVLHKIAARGRFNIAGIVEDTENGHQKYEALLGGNPRAGLPVPIISVARSKLKEPEDFLVGQAVVFSADALLRECGLLLTGKQAAVFGYGKIGSSIAAALRAKGVMVHVHDCNPVRQALAFAHGYGPGNRERIIGEADFLFCATGNKSMKSTDTEILKHGAFIFTATSGDDEIEDYEKILTIRRPSAIHPRVSSVPSTKGSVFLCNDGNSVNFMHGGVVGPFIKLVQAELILALSQLRTAHRDRISQLSDESKRFIAEIWFSHFHDSYREKK